MDGESDDLLMPHKVLAVSKSSYYHVLASGLTRSSYSARKDELCLLTSGSDQMSPDVNANPLVHLACWWKFASVFPSEIQDR